MFPTLYSNRSAAHLKVNNGKAAETDARITVAMKPSWPKAHMRLGGALMSLGRPDDAATSFRTACDLEPGNREYEAAANDARFRATAPRGGPTQPHVQAHAQPRDQPQAQAGGGLSEQVSQFVAQTVVWASAHQTEILQGMAVIVALYVITGGGGGGGALGDNFPQIILIGGAVYSESTVGYFHRITESPSPSLFCFCQWRTGLA
jgi:hypothetical protein